MARERVRPDLLEVRDLLLVLVVGVRRRKRRRGLMSALWTIIRCRSRGGPIGIKEGTNVLLSLSLPRGRHLEARSNGFPPSPPSSLGGIWAPAKSTNVPIEGAPPSVVGRVGRSHSPAFGEQKSPPRAKPRGAVGVYLSA